jgi:peptidoglycan/LPS O-acetylase OafA/YrhL
MNKKLGYINAIKGIACLGVFFHHLLLILLPATYSGNANDSIIAGDYILGYTPLGIFINGNFWVCTFLLISAFLLSRSIFNSKDKNKKVLISLVKRYPRLMIPVLIINLITISIQGIMHYIGLDVVNEIDYDFFGTIKLSLFDIWFTSGVNVAGYWMMNLLFLGSILAIIVPFVLCKLKHNYQSRLILFVLLVAVAFISTYYISTVIGIWLAFECEKTKKFESIREKLVSRNLFHRFIVIVLIIAIIYFGGYPSSGMRYDGVYYIFNYFPDVIKNSPQLFHIIGAAFILILMMLENLSIFNIKTFEIMGNISYSIYLIHPLVNSFCAIPLYNLLENYFTAGFAILCVIVFSTILVIFFSSLFYKYIEKGCNRILNKIINNILGN